MTIIKRLKQHLKSVFAEYRVSDNYGTVVYCWTLCEAMDWLKHCGDKAVIRFNITDQIIVGRTQDI